MERAVQQLFLPKQKGFYCLTKSSVSLWIISIMLSHRVTHVDARRRRSVVVLVLDQYDSLPPPLLRLTH